MVSVVVEQRATIAVAVAAAATATRIRHDKILAVVFFFTLLSLPDAGDSLTELSQLFSLEHFQTSRSSVQSRQPDRQTQTHGDGPTSPMVRIGSVALLLAVVACWAVSEARRMGHRSFRMTGTTRSPLLHRICKEAMCARPIAFDLPLQHPPW